MATVPKELLEVIAEAALIFQKDTIVQLTQNLRRRKLISSAQLINSLDAEGRTDLARLVHSVSFALEEYGRYQDIRGKRWRDLPNIDKIKQSIRNKIQSNPNFFGPDPRPYKRKVKTLDRRINEIAWGVANTIFANQQRDRGNPWFQKTFFRGLQALKEQLLVSLGDHTLEQMKQELTARLKRGPTGSYQA